MKRQELAEVNNLLITGEVYHIFNKSIAGFRIFNTDTEFSRLKELLTYYEIERPPLRFSYSFRLKNQYENKLHGIYPEDNFNGNKERLIDIIAYLIMPTHFHLVLRQLREKGISIFMNNISNSYTRYFNTRHKRKGPLWVGRFKRVRIGSDEQLLHLTRYIHLNPTTVHLVNNPEDWPWSSYKEYINRNESGKICRYSDVLDIEPEGYKKFVIERKDYQQHLAKIKNLLLEVDKE